MEASGTVTAVGSQPMTHFSNSTTTNASDSGDQQSGPQPSPPKRSKEKSKNRRSAETSVESDQQPGPQPSPPKRSKEKSKNRRSAETSVEGDQQPAPQPSLPKRSKGKSKKKRSAETAVLDAQHSTAEALGRSGKSLASNRSSPHEVSQSGIVLVVHANGVAGVGSSCPASTNKAKRSGLQSHRKWPAGSSEKRGNADGDCGLGLPLPPRVKRWLTRDHSIEGKEIRNILILGASFQLMFTAYFAIQNLQSSLHEEGALGASALGCKYGISIVSSLLAPTLIGLIGAKGCVVAAWFCYILYTLAQFYPGWGTLVPASVLLGAFLGPLWTAQGLYVSACGFSFSKRSPHSPFVILSRFNGLFFMLYETTQIVGNLVSSLVLQDGVSNKSEAVDFKFCGTNDCPWTENVTDIEEPDAWVLHTLHGIYIGLQILGLVLTVVLVTPLPKSEWVAKVRIRDTATSWLTTLLGTELLFLVPFMIFQSLQEGILLGEYTKAYISCPIGIHMVGFVMAAYGAVTATFVFIFSRLARRSGPLPLFLLAALINLVVLTVIYNWTPDPSMTTLIFIIPSVWGLSQAIWQTQTNAMIAVAFRDKKEPAFAIYQACRAVGFTLTFSFHGHLCVFTSVSIAIGFLVVGILLYIGVELRRRFSERINGPSRRHFPKDVISRHASGRAADETDEEESDSSKGRPEKQLNVLGDKVSAAEMRRLYTEDDDEEDERKRGHRLTVDGVYLAFGESAQMNNDIKRFQTDWQRVSVSHYARSRSEEAANHNARSSEVKAFQVMPRSQSLDEIELFDEAEVWVQRNDDHFTNYKVQRKIGETYVY